MNCLHVPAETIISLFMKRNRFLSCLILFLDDCYLLNIQLAYSYVKRVYSFAWSIKGALAHARTRKLVFIYRLYIYIFIKYLIK